MSTPLSTYTAAELAAAVNRELGMDLTARTVYFYRSKGVLSPLTMVGSQPKFTDRHRLELKAAIALQRALDRPSLDEVAVRLRALDEGQLDSIGSMPLSKSDDFINRSEFVREASTPYLSSPQQAREPGFGSEGMAFLASAGAHRLTVEISPRVALRLAGDLPDEFVVGLLRCVRSYCAGHGEVPN